MSVVMLYNETEIVTSVCNEPLSLPVPELCTQYINSQPTNYEAETYPLYDSGS